MLRAAFQPVPSGHAGITGSTSLSKREEAFRKKKEVFIKGTAASNGEVFAEEVYEPERPEADKTATESEAKSKREEAFRKKRDKFLNYRPADSISEKNGKNLYYTIFPAMTE